MRWDSNDSGGRIERSLRKSNGAAEPIKLKRAVQNVPVRRELCRQIPEGFSFFFTIPSLFFHLSLYPSVYLSRTSHSFSLPGYDDDERLNHEV